MHIGFPYHHYHIPNNILKLIIFVGQRIPKQFSSAHIKGSSRKAMLWASDRFWPVKLLVYPLWSSVLTTGWVDFVKENALREGDVCVFEMYGSNDVVLKVTFFRCLA